MKRTFIPPHYRPCVPGAHLCAKPKGASSKKQLRPIIVIAASEDIVPGKFLQDLTGQADRVSQLFYDDLGVSWDFSFYESKLCIFQGETSVYPSAIYHRHPGLKKAQLHYHKHMAFLEALEQWAGNCLGQMSCHFHNSSKIYQLISSLRQAREKADEKAISFPRSFFVKGNFDSVSPKLAPSLIVKSCSSQRSKVATGEEFQNWDKNNIGNLPTLFQEHIRGEDVRVHVCGDTLWALKVQNKDHLDYRYSSPGSVNYEKIDLGYPIQNFCKSVSQVENNPLLGIDFVFLGTRVFCLESNPGPGWSTFDHPSKSGFSEAIFSRLASDQTPNITGRN